MKAAVLSDIHKLSIVNQIVPEPTDHEVRIKLSHVGICGSDVHLFLGHRKLEKPIIIGHEGIGNVDKIGKNVGDLGIGQRVAIEPNIACRECKYCLSGKGNICINKKIIGLNASGCFAEYVCVPASHVWTIPDGVSIENAVTLEPTAVAVHALFSSHARPGDCIAIIGLGAIGLLLCHLASRLGYKVLVSELNESKLQRAISMKAIPIFAQGDLIQQSEILGEKYKQNNVVAVFECAGSDFTASLAAAAAPRGSEVMLLGLSEKNALFNPLKIIREGIHIVPSIIYDHPIDFARSIHLIMAKVINPGIIISSYTVLENIQQAFESAATGNESKIIVKI